jgi:hypothetical protein
LGDEIIKKSKLKKNCQRKNELQQKKKREAHGEKKLKDDIVKTKLQL